MLLPWTLDPALSTITSHVRTLLMRCRDSRFTRHQAAPLTPTMVAQNLLFGDSLKTPQTPFQNGRTKSKRFRPLRLGRLDYVFRVFPGLRRCPRCRHWRGHSRRVPLLRIYLSLCARGVCALFQRPLLRLEGRFQGCAPICWSWARAPLTRRRRS